MKVFPLFVLCVILLSTPVYSDDRVEHLAVSYAAAYTCSHLTSEPVICSVATFGLGLVKETLVDKHFEKSDVFFNGVGVGFSFLLYHF